MSYVSFRPDGSVEVDLDRYLRSDEGRSALARIGAATTITTSPGHVLEGADNTSTDHLDRIARALERIADALEKKP